MKVYVVECGDGTIARVFSTLKKAREFIRDNSSFDYKELRSSVISYPVDKDDYGTLHYWTGRVR